MKIETKFQRMTLRAIGVPERDRQSFQAVAGTSDLMLIFQYYPTRLTESIEVVYSDANVPGASHAVYQWVSTGNRTIDLETVFASDVQVRYGADEFSINVADAMNALRYFVYPSYQTSLRTLVLFQASAPPLLELTLLNSRIGGNSDSIRCIIKSLTFDYVAFFPNGEPRYVVCGMSLVEIVNSIVAFKFTDRVDKFVAALARYRRSFPISKV